MPAQHPAVSKATRRFMPRRPLFHNAMVLAVSALQKVAEGWSSEPLLWGLGQVHYSTNRPQLAPGQMHGEAGHHNPITTSIPTVAIVD